MFSPPAGSALVHFVGRGSSFDVAVVELHRAGHAGQRCIAKRPTASQQDDLVGRSVGRGAIERERAALGALRCAAVPALLEAGEDERGPYVIESLIAGVALRECLPATASTLAQPVRVRIATSILLLTQELHDARGADDAALELVHADVGPDAFLLLKGGALAAIDFGSAGVRTSHGRLEPTGRGTLPYVAPELCRADCPPSAATDRYAAALLATELLVGLRLPRASSDAAQLMQIGERGHDIEGLLRGDKALPERVRVALSEQLRFEPGARPERLDEVVLALNLFC